MLRRLGRLVLALCLVGGFVLTSYGVLRESFADLATTGDVGFGGEGFGAGRFGGGGLTRVAEAAVRVGVALRLLPARRQLGIADRHHNAGAAIPGVLLLLVPTLVQAWETYRGP